MKQLNSQLLSATSVEGENNKTMMKQNFRVFLLAAIIIIPFGIKAQTWNFGIEAGYVNSDLSVSESSAKSRNGFKFGANAEFTLRNNLSLESGVSFIRKGATVTGDNMMNTAVSSIKLAEMDYLQIPVMAGYRFNVGNGFYLKPELGAYLAVGINGDSFVTGLDPFNQPYEKRVRTFSGANGVSYRPCNRVDGGLSFAINAKWHHIGLKAEYDLGLATASYYGNGKQRCLSASIIYWLY